MNQSQSKNKNTVPENHPLMKSPIGIPFKHLMNAKAMNHAFMQHEWHMGQRAMQGMASGGTMQQNQGPQPTAPQQAQPNRINRPAAPAPAKPNGPTAVNPKTGQRIMYHGGKWQPVR